MERLTIRDSYGNADIIGVDSTVFLCDLAFSDMNRVTEALNRLAHYEDLEEQGRLIRLPCAIGEKVYMLSPIDCENCQYYDGKTDMEHWLCNQDWCPQKIVEGKFDMTMLHRVGTRVFASRAEAEAALTPISTNDVGHERSQTMTNADKKILVRFLGRVNFHVLCVMFPEIEEIELEGWRHGLLRAYVELSTEDEVKTDLRNSEKECDKIMKINYYLLKKYKKEIFEEFGIPEDDDVGTMQKTIAAFDRMYEEVQKEMPGMWYEYGFGGKE